MQSFLGFNKERKYYSIPSLYKSIIRLYQFHNNNRSVMFNLRLSQCAEHFVIFIVSKLKKKTTQKQQKTDNENSLFFWRAHRSFLFFFFILSVNRDADIDYKYANHFSVYILFFLFNSLLFSFFFPLKKRQISVQNDHFGKGNINGNDMRLYDHQSLS